MRSKQERAGTQRVWELGAFGIDELSIVERATLKPGPGEVRVRMEAWSLNYRDLLMVEGRYDPRQPLPLVPLSDGAGVIDALGPGTSLWSPGDRVIPTFSRHWSAGPPDRRALRSTLGGPDDGTAAEYIVCAEEALVGAPQHLSLAEAATLPCAALTAWNALVTQGEIKTGDTVVILGTGGVALFALQFALAHGARCAVVTSTPEKESLARSLGAEHTINYKSEPSWGRRARSWAGPGADHVVEVGGAGTLQESLRAVRPGGTVSLIGVLSGGSAPIDLVPVLMNQIRIQGIFVGDRASFEAMNRAIEAHELRPRLWGAYSFSELPDALRALAEARHTGKISIQRSPSKTTDATR